ncbi:hypothetical protein AYI68_g7965 [Smittium mucronatum]|uniref:Dynactin subunit 3 n=1 Tax=Smittium mucronatum TaxID=133383 RepID=A0A1R0GMA4_9FUNG|nr:hypothetical protein AYI68_g7965 [Smittium mucronatum]
MNQLTERLFALTDTVLGPGGTAERKPGGSCGLDSQLDAIAADLETAISQNYIVTSLLTKYSRVEGLVDDVYSVLETVRSDGEKAQRILLFEPDLQRIDKSRELISHTSKALDSASIPKVVEMEPKVAGFVEGVGSFDQSVNLLEKDISSLVARYHGEISVINQVFIHMDSQLAALENLLHHESE